MAYFQLGEQQLQLKTGPQRVGPAGTGADLALPGGPSTASAVVTVNADQSVIIQKAAPDSVVVVNSVALGAEPSPLIHGDRVEMGGHTLRFGDTKQAGSTQFVSGADLAKIIEARKASGPTKPTLATGGRIVSLVDGREYTIPASGLIIGRDPSADVVISAGEASRKHIQIGPVTDGYVLKDLSTNGVWVNGVRVSEQQVLGRGDVIKIATEEFRFYADAAKTTPAPSTAPPVAVPAAVAPVAVEVVSPPPALPGSRPVTPTAPMPSPPAAPPPIAAAPPIAAPPPPVQAPLAPRPAAPATPAPAMPAPAKPSAPAAAPPSVAPPAPVAPSVQPPAPKPAPAAPKPVSAPAPAAPAPARAPSGRPALALLEILNETDKGRQLEVFGPLTNIGRGEHNDLVIANESVSDSHAKLQKRESGWVIVDIDSTNGTYVGGRRVTGEQALTGAPDLRFGDVKVSFRPAAETVDPAKSTRAIVGVSVEEARRMAARKSAADAPQVPLPPEVVAQETPAEKRGGMSVAAWVALAIVAGGLVAYYFFAKG